MILYLYASFLSLKVHFPCTCVSFYNQKNPKEINVNYNR